MGRSEIKAVEDADDCCNDADDDGSDAGNRQGGEEKRQEHEHIGLEGALDGGEPVELEQLFEVARQQAELDEGADEYRTAGQVIGGYCGTIEGNQQDVFHDELRTEIAEDKGVFACVELLVYACVAEGSARAIDIERYGDDEHKRLIVFKPALQQIIYGIQKGAWTKIFVP